VEEVYILDSLLRKVDVVDDYTSLIWTERFDTAGDFELRMASTPRNRQRLVEGVRLAMNKSYRIMTIERIEDTTDEEGNEVVVYTGPSLEMLMDGRVARSALSNLTTNPKWTITDKPAVIARKIFHDICVTGVLSSSDIIPMIHEGSTVFPTDTIPEPADTITYEMDPMTVYSAEIQLLPLYNMGFRLCRFSESSGLWFDVYMGCDRTTGQTTLPPVIFSEVFENLTNTKEVRSIENYKNVAYVLSPAGDAVVYPPDIDPATITGLNRRVLVVVADDIDDASPSVSLPRLIQRGHEALAQQRQFAGFDGEISQYSQYQYQRDYWLGDLVEVRNKSGSTDVMRVTEHIFASDEQGERSYPTLLIEKFITPGTWADWDPTEHWSEVDPALEWQHASD
jgi:hypothetical protein